MRSRGAPVMLHPPIEELELSKRAVRAKICPGCYQCPGSERALNQLTPRSCEAACMIFINLPAMHLAVTNRLTVLSDADKAVEQVICETCHARPTSGEFCAEFASRTCPLSRYGRDV